MNQADFRTLALSYPQVDELPHFEKTSFRVKKKIFATLDEKNNRICVKLSIADQGLFSLFDKSIIYPVPNKWGKQGWTFIELEKVPDETLHDLLNKAYELVSGKNIC